MFEEIDFCDVTLACEDKLIPNGLIWHIHCGMVRWFSAFRIVCLNHELLKSHQKNMSHVCAFCFCTSFQDILHQFILTSQCYITKVIQANSKKGHKTNYKSNINKHIKTIHKKDMPLICDHCPKRFSSKGTLEQHIKNTCGVKPQNGQNCFN